MKRRVLLIDENDGRAVLLVEALQEADCEVVARFTVDDDLSEFFSKYDVDLLVINIDVPGSRLLNQLHKIVESRPMPIVVFADRSESPIINAAIKAGVSAFVVDGLEKRRISPVLDVALARFEDRRELHEQLHSTREQLENRKLVDRAKSIIMKKQNIDEDSAYKALRTMAMNKNMRIHEVARNLITVADLLV